MTTAMYDRDPVAENITTAVTETGEIFRAAVADVPVKLTSDVTELGRQVDSLMATATGAVARAKAHRANLDIHPDGRAARAQAELDAADAALNETARVIDVRVKVLEASLLVEAFPAVTDPVAVVTARMDAQAILDGAENKVQALHALAVDDDTDIVDLVVGQWGRRYARAHGIDDQQFEAMRTIALGKQAEGTDYRAQVARAALSMSNLRAAAGAAGVLARSVLTHY